MAGCGRLLSMRKVGLPSKVFLGYLFPELMLPWAMGLSQYSKNCTSGCPSKGLLVGIFAVIACLLVVMVN